MVSGEALFNQLGILEKAIAQLKTALEQTFNEFIRDSAIKRFEIAFKLLWKIWLQKYVKGYSATVNKKQSEVGLKYIK